MFYSKLRWKIHDLEREIDFIQDCRNDEKKNYDNIIKDLKVRIEAYKEMNCSFMEKYRIIKNENMELIAKVDTYKKLYDTLKAIQEASDGSETTAD